MAELDCRLCLKYEIDIETGKVERHPGTGEPIERIDESWTPCRRFAAGKREKLGPCPKGTPENQKALTPQNQIAYNHYLECKAVGVFPDDPIVRRHAALIRSIEDAYQLEQSRLMALSALSIPAVKHDPGRTPKTNGGA